MKTITLLFLIYFILLSSIQGRKINLDPSFNIPNDKITLKNSCYCISPYNCPCKLLMNHNTFIVDDEQLISNTGYYNGKYKGYRFISAPYHAYEDEDEDDNEDEDEDFIKRSKYYGVYNKRQPGFHWRKVMINN